MKIGNRIAILMAAMFMLDLRTSTSAPGIDQNLGGRIPLADAFRDEAGTPITMSALASDKPVILVMVYFGCPRLCTYVLNGLAQGLDGVALQPGRDYRVAVVSIDPREGPDLAAAKKEAYLGRIGRDKGAEAGWRFLTGTPESIDALAGAAGFRFAFDSASGEYAHPAAAIVLAPEGRISRYLPGVQFRPQDLRLALVEASQGKLGGLADRVFLSCSSFDTATGRYTASVTRVLRGLGVFLVLGLAGGGIWLERKVRIGRNGRNGRNGRKAAGNRAGDEGPAADGLERRRADLHG